MAQDDWSIFYTTFDESHCVNIALVNGPLYMKYFSSFTEFITAWKEFNGNGNETDSDAHEMAQVTEKGQATLDTASCSNGRYDLYGIVIATI